MNLVERAKGIILRPSQTWLEIKEEKTTISELYTSYAVILAAIPAVAQFIGTSMVGYSLMGTHIKLGFGSALGQAITQYVLSLVAIYVVALIADALAPKFNSRKDILNAFKAVVFSMTPAWVGGVFLVIPTLAGLTLLASLYGIYLFYLGLPLLMETPKEKSLIYVIVVIIITFVVNVVVGGIAGAIFSPFGYRP